MYYGVVFFLLFLSFVSCLSRRYSVKRLLYCVAVFTLIIINGLRDPFIFPDNQNYFDFFKGDLSAADAGTLNFGYLFFNWIMGVFFPYFQLFCFFVAVIIICSYAKLILSYSPYICLSLLLYVFVSYLPSFFLLRQYLAMPFVFLSFKYVIRKERTKYWLSVLLAFSFHTTALIVAPVYYLYGLKYSKKNMMLIIAGTIAASLCFMAVGAIIGSLFPYYSQYVEMTAEEPAWQRALMKGYILLIYIFALKKHFYDVGVNRLIFYSMLMNVIICIGAMNIMGVFRLREYFSLADFIGIPVILYYAQQMRFPKKHIVYFMAIVYIVLLFLSYDSFVNGGNIENKYQFFWEAR